MFKTDINILHRAGSPGKPSAYKTLVYASAAVWICGMLASLIAFGTFRADAAPESMDHAMRCTLGFAIGAPLAMGLCRVAAGKLWSVPAVRDNRIPDRHHVRRHSHQHGGVSGGARRFMGNAGDSPVQRPGDHILLGRPLRPGLRDARVHVHGTVDVLRCLLPSVRHRPAGSADFQRHVHVPLGHNVRGDMRQARGRGP